VLDDEKDGRRVVYRIKPELCLPSRDADSLATLDVGGYRLVIRKGSGLAVPVNPKKSARKAAAKGKTAG
jgi:hypothetical protein